MLTWYPNLYLDPAMKKSRNIKRLKKAFDKGRFSFPCFLITLAVNESNELEIINTAILRQKKVSAYLPMVVGIALTHKTAVDLVTEITEQVFRETKDVKIRQFLTERS